MKTHRFAAIAATAILVAALAPSAIVAGSPDEAETVMITFRPKPGAEADLVKVIAGHWTTARRLDLVLPQPHVTVRATDETGRDYFVDVFTWRSAEIPDHAPAEIQAIWADMTRLTEARNGKPGLAIVEGRMVTP